MKNKALLEEIAINNTIIDYHIKRLKKKPEQLHDIDIDLLTEKLKQIYSLVHELETAKAGYAPLDEIIEKIEVVEEKIKEIKDIPEPEPEPEPEIEPEPVAEEVVKKVKEAIEAIETIIEEKPEPAPVFEAEKEKLPAAEEIIEEISVTVEEEIKITKPKTTADLFSGTTTIADAYQKNKDTSIAATTGQQPIADLKKAIGINDKFLFINELFKGDPGQYNIVINKLNAVEGLAEAENMMQGYVSEYGWTEEGAAYQRLAGLVHAKF